MKKAESHIREAAPQMPVRWLNKTDHAGEVEKRGGFVGCVVNARPIASFVLDKEGFQREVREALGAA